MIGKTQLLKNLQSDMTQADFADLLGVSQPYLSMIYSGQRQPGMAVATSLLRNFPERRDEIAGVFFSETITEEA